MMELPRDFREWSPNDRISRECASYDRVLSDLASNFAKMKKHGRLKGRVWSHKRMEKKIHDRRERMKHKGTYEPKKTLYIWLFKEDHALYNRVGRKQRKEVLHAPWNWVSQTSLVASYDRKRKEQHGSHMITWIEMHDRMLWRVKFQGSHTWRKTTYRRILWKMAKQLQRMTCTIAQVKKH